MTKRGQTAVAAARARVVRLTREAVSRSGSKTLRRLSPPTVSIIVPIYNVEQYLRECLDSVLSQTFVDFEVIIVDDGSPDGSRAIADEYAVRDPRFRVVGRPNGGLGAARNTGIRAARGRYLTFVDSDDVLPVDAIRVLVDSAITTGSDIVIGSMQRFDKLTTWYPEWVDGVHLQRREAVTVDEFLPLLRNFYTVNKLFRRRFWMTQHLWLREGVPYEDQPIITQLLVRAKAIDVLPDVVYLYRKRDDASSISQQTASVADLKARTTAWELTRSALAVEASPEIYHGWLQTLFNAHFHWYLTSPSVEVDEYWHRLRAAVADFARDAPESVWDATPPDRRVLVRLALKDRPHDVMEFFRSGGTKFGSWPSTLRHDGVLLELPFFGDRDLDDETFLIRPAQLSLAHALESFHWEGTVAVLSGWAFIRKVDLHTLSQRVSLVMRNVRSGAELEYPAAKNPDPPFPAPIEDAWCDYSSGTFLVRAPMDDLVAHAEPDDEWLVLLRVRVGGHSVTEPVHSLLRSGSAGMIRAVSLPGGRRLVVDWHMHETLRVRVERKVASIDEVELSGRVLSGVVSGVGTRSIRRVVVESEGIRAAGRVRRDSSGAGRFSVTLPPAPKANGSVQAHWDVRLVGFGGTVPNELRQSAADVVLAVSPMALVVTRARNGELALLEGRIVATADTLRQQAGGVLTVEGEVAADAVECVSVVATHKKVAAQGAWSAVEGRRFSARVPLSSDLFRFGHLPLPTGHHDLSLDVRRKDSSEVVRVPLLLAPVLNDQLPLKLAAPRLEGRVIRGRGGAVGLSLDRPIGDARGRYQQNRLRVSAPADSRTRGVLVRSYFGESATDSGVSIQHELRRRGSDLPVYWAVQDFSVPVPDGGIPVVVNSREWYQLLGSISYYIDNMFQPEYHLKPRGQVVVQTFHGYPFKLMGHRHWERSHLSARRIASYDERARQWDYLVSPASYATPLLTRAFAYGGQVLEIGYPRNDVLKSAEADELRAVVRASLGIADRHTAVLYAPTFRDYMTNVEGRAAMAELLDFAALTRALGDDVVLLIRGHAFNARSRMRVARAGRIVDVTDYPEVSDLYLAADAAIVDYSSLRFDFGVTGKPMVFLVPDLQRYKDTRGWLFDFEPTAPGPMVETTAEVIEELKDLPGLKERYRDEYQVFAERFLDLDDGHAAARFVDAVFVPRGDA
jgi:CDP-glycerol glycerophosphotransferase